jgi:hypothetical protein
VIDGEASWHPHVRGEVERTCRACVIATAAEGGGVSLVTASGHRATVCATDEVASVIEERQFTLGEGPCVDATTSLSPVLVADLRDPGEGVQRRWPAFLDAAEGVGVRAAFAFPLRIGALALGAMDLYRTTPGGLSAEQLRAALLTADTLALRLLDLRQELEDEEDGRAPAAYRLEVHGAAGMLTVQLGVGIDAALAHLRATAFATDRPVEAVAADIIAGRLRLDQEEQR